jgi:hypothetical protein
VALGLARRLRPAQLLGAAAVRRVGFDEQLRVRRVARHLVVAIAQRDRDVREPDERLVRRLRHTLSRRRRQQLGLARDRDREADAAIDELRGVVRERRELEPCGQRHFFVRASSVLLARS